MLSVVGERERERGVWNDLGLVYSTYGNNDIPWEGDKVMAGHRGGGGVEEGHGGVRWICPMILWKNTKRNTECWCSGPYC